MNRYVFDIESLKTADEVGGWINKHRMGISVLCMKDYDSGEDFVFSDQYKGALPLSDLYNFTVGNTLIGYNINSFDWRLLLEQFKRDKMDILIPVNLLDMKLYRCSLGGLSQATFNTDKLMSGALAPTEWRKGGSHRDKVVEYCIDDVKKTAELLTYGLENKFVYHIDKKGIKSTVKVEWETKLNAEPVIQYPVCYGGYRIKKKSYQCGRCAFVGFCKKKTKDES